jgi:MFS family permease
MAQQDERGRIPVDVREDALLLRGSRFRRLFESRIAGQTATNAMVYALLILLVEEGGSSLQATVFVIALTLPAAVLGIPAGTVADMLPRRLTMLVSYAARAAIAVALVYYGGNTWNIYLLALLHASIGQFFGPTEAAVVPVVAGREKLGAANSLMTLALMVGQIAGMVVLAPLLIKLASPDAVFAVSAVLFVLAGWFILLSRRYTARSADSEPGVGFLEATRRGLEIVRTNRKAYLSIVYLTITVALSKVLVILMPEYTRSVLEIEPEDAVFVALPAAIGAVLALALAPPLSALLGAWRVVVLGFVLLLLGLFGLGFVVYVRDFIMENLDFGIGFVEDEVGVSSVITVTMLLAIPLGFAFTLVSVASRVVLNQQAPPETQGRVFAVQMSLGDLLSLAPLLAVGAVADIFGVRATLLLATFAALMVGAYLTFRRRPGPDILREPQDKAGDGVQVEAAGGLEDEAASGEQEMD